MRAINAAVATIAALTAMAALSSCAHPGALDTRAQPADGVPSDIAASKTAQAAWQPAPARAGEVIYAGAGIRTMPAPSGTQPKVTSATAEATAMANAPINLGSSAPQAALRLVTNNDFANSALTTPRLEWVITYPDTQAVYFGGPGFVAPSPAPLCPFIEFVDASTGSPLGSYQLCDAK